MRVPTCQEDGRPPQAAPLGNHREPSLARAFSGWGADGTELFREFWPVTAGTIRPVPQRQVHPHEESASSRPALAQALRESEARLGLDVGTPGEHAGEHASSVSGAWARRADQLLHGDGRHCGGRRTPHGLQRRGRCKTDLQRALRAQCRGQICQIDIVAGDCSAHRARLRSPASRLYASWFGRVSAVRGVLLRWASPRVSHQRRWGVLSQASSCRQPLLGQARRAF